MKMYAEIPPVRCPVCKCVEKLPAYTFVIFPDEGEFASLHFCGKCEHILEQRGPLESFNTYIRVLKSFNQPPDGTVWSAYELTVIDPSRYADWGVKDALFGKTE